MLNGSLPPRQLSECDSCPITLPQFTALLRRCGFKPGHQGLPNSHFPLS